MGSGEAASGKDGMKEEVGAERQTSESQARIRRWVEKGLVLSSSFSDSSFL